MDTDINKAKLRFQNEAAHLSMLVFEDFERNTKNLDRQEDENVFLQLQSRYTDALKNQLSHKAEMLINSFKSDSARYTLRKELASQMSYVLSGLLLKFRSM